MVLAGVGSGKTKTLLQKIIYLIEEKGVSPSGILEISFTKNATNEMIARQILSADTSNKYLEILLDKLRRISCNLTGFETCEVWILFFFNLFVF